MNQPSPRRRRRNQLLLAGLVPSLAAAAVAVALLVMLTRNALGLDATEHGDHASARQHFAANRWIGTVERWIAPYNEGVATLRLGLYDDALADFLVALELVPEHEECRVLHNIAVTLELGGDAAAVVTGGERRAIDLYRRAREALADGRCLERIDDAGSEGDQAGGPGSGVDGVDGSDGSGSWVEGSADAGSVVDRVGELDARLTEKIAALLDRLDQEALAGLTAEERAGMERATAEDQRAKERDERIRDADSENSADPDDPPDPDDPQDADDPQDPDDPNNSEDPQDPDDPNDSEDPNNSEDDDKVEYGW